MPRWQANLVVSSPLWYLVWKVSCSLLPTDLTSFASRSNSDNRPRSDCWPECTQLRGGTHIENHSFSSIWYIPWLSSAHAPPLLLSLPFSLNWEPRFEWGSRKEVLWHGDYNSSPAFVSSRLRMTIGTVAHAFSANLLKSVYCLDKRGWERNGEENDKLGI